MLDSEALLQCRSLLEAVADKRIVVPDTNELPNWVCRTDNRYFCRNDLTPTPCEPAVQLDDGAHLLFTGCGSAPAEWPSWTNGLLILRDLPAQL